MNEPLILHAASRAGEGVPLPLVLAGYPAEIEGQPCHYRRKEVIRAGEWVHRGTRQPFQVDRSRLASWVATFNRRLAAGIKPYIPDRHTEQPKAGENFGYVLGLSCEGDSLYADVQLIGDDALTLAAKNDVSVYVKPEGVDAKGGACGEYLHHLALTPDPNQPNLSPFYRIAASASADGPDALDVPVYEPASKEIPMFKPETLEKLRAKFQVAKTEKLTDEQLGEAIAGVALSDPPADKTAEVTALSAQVTTLTKERDDAKKSADTATLALSAAVPKEYDPLALTLITESFGTWRDKAVTSGSISENGMKALDALMIPGGKPSPIALSLSAGSTRPLYAQVCEIIAGNPGVKTGHSVTRATSNLQLSADSADPLAHMTPEERSAYAAQCMGVSPVAKSA